VGLGLQYFASQIHIHSSPLVGFPSGLLARGYVIPLFAIIVTYFENEAMQSE
jgi:hypothetical protein